ncbi:hypothetical protein J4Y61_11190, partial [Escherichia coli]
RAMRAALAPHLSLVSVTIRLSFKTLTQQNQTKSLKNVLQYTEGHYRTMQKGEALRLPLKH